MENKEILDKVCDELKERIPMICAEFERVYSPHHTIRLTSGYRRPEEQFQLFMKGRSLDIKTDTWLVTNKQKVVTFCDGYKAKSPHTLYPSQAVDIAIVSYGEGIQRLIWIFTDGMWNLITCLANKYGLVHGATFQRFKDYPHIETKNWRQEG